MEEVDLIEKLCGRRCLVCSLAATCYGQLVGHILFTPVTVELDTPDFAAVALGPMAVLPEHQRKAIGWSLGQVGLDGCLRLGPELVFVLAHADYYPRFGSVAAKLEGIVHAFEASGEALMPANRPMAHNRIITTPASLGSPTTWRIGDYAPGPKIDDCSTLETPCHRVIADV